MDFKVKRRIYAEINDLTLEVQGRHLALQVESFDAYSHPIKALDLLLDFDELGEFIALLEEIRKEIQ